MSVRENISQPALATFQKPDDGGLNEQLETETSEQYVPKATEFIETSDF